jgi:hypothetical protein
MAEAARTTRVLPVALAAAALLGLIPLAEPINGIFRETVELNMLFLVILGAVTLASLSSAVAFARRPGRQARQRSLRRVLWVLVVLEVILLGVVWVTIFTTGAYGSGHVPGGGFRNVPLQHG